MAGMPGCLSPEYPEWFSESIYNVYIKKYWEGEVVKFYDSNTSFPEGSEYELSPENLSTQLNSGFDFITMVSHGNVDLWDTEIGSFTSQDAGLIQSPSSSFIFSAGCLTNAFDYPESTYPDGCLSEAFIRNPNSGVIAYWGCSRESWGKAGVSSMSPNVVCCFTPLRNIFWESRRSSTWGELCTHAKIGFNFNISTQIGYWHSLGFNPIGDPAMLIYEKNPKHFGESAIKINSSELLVNPEIENCKIFIMNIENNVCNSRIIADDQLSMKYGEFPQTGNICISKKGFVPYALSYANIQNVVMSENETIAADFILIGQDDTASVDSNVIIESGKLQIEGKTLILGKGFSISKGAELEYKRLNQ